MLQGPRDAAAHHVPAPGPWAEDAACHGRPGAWDHDAAAAARDEAEAVCWSCPVRAACATYGDAHRLVGTWGALYRDEATARRRAPAPAA